MNLKKLFKLIIVVVLVVLPFSRIAQSQLGVPSFAEISVPPNVMIILDGSGSMQEALLSNEIITDLDGDGIHNRGIKRNTEGDGGALKHDLGCTGNIQPKLIPCQYDPDDDLDRAFVFETDEGATAIDPSLYDPSNSVNGFNTVTNPDSFQSNRRMDVAYAALHRILDDNGDGIIDQTDQENVGARIGFGSFFSGRFPTLTGRDYEAVQKYASEPLCISDESPQPFRLLTDFFDSSYVDVWKGIQTIRAKAVGGTPLADSLRATRENVISPVLADDPAKACRYYYVILITDGADTCANGGSGYLYPDDDPRQIDRNEESITAASELYQGAGSLNGFSVPVFVIGFSTDILPAFREIMHRTAQSGGTDANTDGDNDPTTYSSSQGTPGGSGGGNAYFARDLESLVQALRDVFTQIRFGSYTRSSPLVRLSIGAQINRAFLGFFDIEEGLIHRDGHLYAYEVNRDPNAVDTSGQAIQVGEILEPNLYDSGVILDNRLPDSPNGQPQNVSSISHRTIFTSVQSGTDGVPRQRVDFDLTQIDTIRPLIFPPIPPIVTYEVDEFGNEIEVIITSEELEGNQYDQDGDGDFDNDDVQTFIMFVRGQGDYLTLTSEGLTENLDYKMGDIFHSAPVLVTNPQNPLLYGVNSSYSQFVTDNLNRTPLVYVGANDGMLHAFYVKDFTDTNPDVFFEEGAEAWAYIPQIVVDNFRDLRVAYSYYVDGSPVTYDVYIDANGDGSREWRTILICGLRGGGRGYFALDITDPFDPKPLWEFTANDDQNLGQTYSVPAIGRVCLTKDENPQSMNFGKCLEDAWVAFVTGGYWDQPDVGNYVYAIDLETGLVLESTSGGFAKFILSDLDGDILLDNNNMAPGSLTAVDYDFDALTDVVYFGDFQGRLWRMVTISTDISNWEPNVLFDPGSDFRRPFFFSPMAAFGNNNDLVVIIGTGDIVESEVGTPIGEEGPAIQNYIFAISDPFPLPQISSLAQPGTELYRIVLRPDEVVAAQVDIESGQVAISTVIPNPDDPCSPSQGNVLLFPFYNGPDDLGNPLNPPDQMGQGGVSDNLSTPAGGTAIGGVPMLTVNGDFRTFDVRGEGSNMVPIFGDYTGRIIIVGEAAPTAADLINEGTDATDIVGLYVASATTSTDGFSNEAPEQNSETGGGDTTERIVFIRDAGTGLPRGLGIQFFLQVF